MEQELKGKVALVTGGGTGIGRAIAEELAAAGAAVAITGRRPEVLETAAAEIAGQQEGSRVLAIAGDVSRRQDCERMVRETVDGLGDLHVLVNNAGVARGGPFEEMSDPDIDLVVDVDLKGPMWMLRAALPHLRRHAEKGGSAVVNVSSSVTFSAVPNFSVYSAAKAGLDMLTRCLALDLAPAKVRVNAICPGVVETPIFETMMPKEAVPRALRQFDQQIPLGRVGQGEDVARLARFLAGPQSEWMTGAVIPLDGGQSLAS